MMGSVNIFDTSVTNILVLSMELRRTSDTQDEFLITLGVGREADIALTPKPQNPSNMKLVDLTVSVNPKYPTPHRYGLGPLMQKCWLERMPIM